jgi:Haem-binding domain
VRWVLLCVLVIVVLGSFLTRLPESARNDAPLLPGAQIDPALLALLRRSCADCHSDTTRYPWYSYVAPVSWLIASDVSDGRRHLNLSRWNEYPVVRRMRSLSEIANQVKDGDMPLIQYTLIHRDARLKPAEVNAIFQWTQAERARLIAASH